MNQSTNTDIDQLNAIIDKNMQDPREQTLKSLRIKPTDRFEQPHVMWSVLNSTGDYGVLGTSGNFSLVIGRAKAKKTFFITIALSMVVSQQLLQGRFKGNLLPSANQVLYFDTEQSKHTVWSSVDRICKQVNVAEPDNLQAYGLRSKTPAERLDLIEYAIYNTERLGFVVIDGARDLVTSINDEEQATMLTSRLMKWTEEKNIHIITVLHQNKGDNNARGHLGTELINKAETVLSVTKSESSPTVSVVAPEQCRNIEPDSFAFEISEDGLPVVADDHVECSATPKRSSPKLTDIEDHKLYEMLTTIFSNKSSIKYAELKSEIRVAYEIKFALTLGSNKAVDLITLLKNKGWVLQEDRNLPYTLGQFNVVV